MLSQEVVAVQGRAERAARLFGAAEMLSETTSLRMDRIKRADYDRAVAASRAQLDDRTFAAAWAAGRAMSLEQTIAYALDMASTAKLLPLPARCNRQDITRAAQVRKQP